MPHARSKKNSTQDSGVAAGNKHSDGGGLCLHVSETGKFWRMNYRFAGKQMTLTLGAYQAMSLAKARQKRGRGAAGARKGP